MKISLIHNMHSANEHYYSSALATISALEEINADYEYIFFNDNGDKEILNQISPLLNDKVIYYYSDFNFGQGKCTGGWIGALPLVTGEIIHNLGQDDIFSPDFYRLALEVFSNPEMQFFTCNGMKCDDFLHPLSPLINPSYFIDYSVPLARFKEWFGVIDQGVTCANNHILAPGTLYRTELHEKIGPPAVTDFWGASDFEYWARMLFNELKGYYHSIPLWNYRISMKSLGFKEESSGTDHRPPYLEKIKLKYSELWNQKMQS